jgi:hypothetical protein
MQTVNETPERMSKEPIDPNTLAAFLEGRLEPHERAALLERLAREPAAFETFAEAAAIERELAGATSDDAREATGTPDKFRPLKGRMPWRWALPLAAAAGIAALLIGRSLRRPDAAPLLLADAATLLAPAGAATLESALGPDWTEPAWTGTRGATSALSPAQRAFRLGSRLVTLGLAADAGDAGAAQRAGLELREVLADVDGGAPLAARLDNIARSVDAAEPPAGAGMPALDDVASDLAALVPAVWLRTGAWLEQARLAARAGALDWFASEGPAIGELRRLIAALQSDPTVPARATATRLEPVLAAAAGGLDRDGLAALIPALDRIADEAAGR